MVVRIVLTVALLFGAVAPAAGQEAAPEPREALPVESLLITHGAILLGKQRVGECGEPGYFSPYGKGVGFLQPQKSWHWRLIGTGQFLSFLGNGQYGELDLCGTADVPPAGLAEVGTAGPCDGVRGTGGRGFVRLPGPSRPFEMAEMRVYRVSDVSWPATGSVMVMSGKVVGDGAVPGDILVLLQRRTFGMCAHKDSDVPVAGTHYPQGGPIAEVVGVLAFTTPRDRVPTGGCEPWWGQVRRHLRGAGAGVECPVPPEI